MSVGHGYVSMAIFILIYRSHSYRWVAVVPQSNWRSWALSHVTQKSGTRLGIAFGCQRVYSHTFTSIMLLHKYLTICRILDGIQAKYLQATILFVDFTNTFDSIHRGKMEQILQAYGLPKETVAAITILYRNTKVKVWSPDGDTEYFDIVAGVLQGDTLAPYLFIICLD